MFDSFEDDQFKTSYLKSDSDIVEYDCDEVDEEDYQDIYLKQNENKNYNMNLKNSLNKSNFKNYDSKFKNNITDEVIQV